MTWAVSPVRRRPGEFLTRGDLAHVGPDRDGAERAGADLGGTPDLLRLEHQSPRVYRVLWSLSAAADGELRPRPARVAPGAPFNAPRLLRGQIVSGGDTGD